METFVVTPLAALLIGGALIIFYLLSCIRIINEYERGVVFR